MIRGSKPWLELNTDWGISTTSGLKKGGHFARGAGGAARLMYPPAGGNTRERDSVHALLAQWLGDGERDGGACSGAHGCSGCGGDVVVIQDTSELALGGRRAKASGYGPVGKGGALRGLLLHAVLAVDAGTGGVLGLVDAKVWNRKGGKVTDRRSRKTSNKESQRWLDGTMRAGEVLAAASQITGVSDRQIAIYTHFATRP